jgi:hypothetical protein
MNNKQTLEIENKTLTILHYIGLHMLVQNSHVMDREYISYSCLQCPHHIIPNVVPGTTSSNFP